MKLTYKFLLLALTVSFTKYAIADEDVDVEIDDDEMEVEEDDATAEEEIAPTPEEPAAQLSPVPLEGVRSFVFFPDGPASITGGKTSEIVVGVQNNGVKDIEMVSCNGKMTMPNTNEVVQNFTNFGYENHEILSKSEASFSYMFQPAMQTGGREFQVALELYYKEKNTNMFYKAEPFNEMVQVLESTEGVMTEIIQLWMTVIALLVGGGYFVYQKQMAKKLLKEATAVGKKVERGTVNDDIDMAWIPKTHQGSKAK